MSKATKPAAQKPTTPLQTNAHITAISHCDVFGKILYYLKIVTEFGEHFINIGQKTHDQVKALTEKPTTNEPTTTP